MFVFLPKTGAEGSIVFERVSAPENAETPGPVTVRFFFGPGGQPEVLSLDAGG